MEITPIRSAFCSVCFTFASGEAMILFSSPLIAKIVFCVSSVGCILSIAWMFIPTTPMHFYWLKLSLSLPKRLIRLNEAALIIYEEMRGTKNGRIVEGLNPSKAICHYVLELAGNTRLYGNHPPSRRIELVDQERMGTLNTDGKTTIRNNKTPIYDNLMIERQRMKEYLKEIRRKEKLCTITSKS